MNKIKVNNLIRGCAEIPIDKIRACIKHHENLIVEYLNEKMEIPWETLCSKFQGNEKLDKVFKVWHFPFVPNFALRKNK